MFKVVLLLYALVCCVWCNMFQGDTTGIAHVYSRKYYRYLGIFDVETPFTLSRFPFCVTSMVCNYDADAALVIEIYRWSNESAYKFPVLASLYTTQCGLKDVSFVRKNSKCLDVNLGIGLTFVPPSDGFAIAIYLDNETEDVNRLF